jgi:hypothetical protein
MPLNVIARIAAHPSRRLPPQRRFALVAKELSFTKAYYSTSGRGKHARVLLESTAVGSAENQIARLLKVLQRYNSLGLIGADRRISVIISVASLAVDHDVTITLSQQLLGRMLSLGCDLEVVAFSMRRARAYKDKAWLRARRWKRLLIV